MSSQPSDGTEIPPEVVVKPYALIGVAGLDNVNNAIHKTIWDAFSNNRRADRAPVNFKLLTNSYEFPVVKPKRNSYEWYIPKGILKRNWINKHVALIPAVIVIFYDMEWNDPQWNEKIIECASRVQSIRAAVEGHTTKVCVVVVQSAPSPPPSEYMLGAERAQALCAACEIHSKALFVLPHSDHLFGYTVRLENAFYDLAQNYYHHETKHIKSHRDHLNKTTHQYLFVRHQFKMGFLNEMKQDSSTAHKHYLHAYNHLLETRIMDTNAAEVKTVAGYINYKLCQLLFNMNLPRDAITQLRSHIDRYKDKAGCSDLIFEHYAWLARQYSAFGELFDDAIRAGLPAVQSQHPGYYYQQAAQYSGLRRQAMHKLCSDALHYPTPPDPLEGVVEFYGQRPWRPGRLSADPHDPQKEQAAIVALQYKERLFNHSVIIISMLGNAISQFKTFRSPRMRKQLVVEMANEYYLCSDYGKSLTLLTHMLWDYRREKWWYLASHVLNQAIRCAFLSANLQDYLTLAIEALSKNIAVPQNDKNRIFKNIQSVLNFSIPDPEPELLPSAISLAIENWNIITEKEPMTIKIDMSTISPFLDVKSRFLKNKYKVDDIICIELFVRLNFPEPIEVRNITVTVVTLLETIEIPVIEADSSAIRLKANSVKKFDCQFKPNSEDSSSELQLKNVTFSIGSDKKRNLELSFNVSTTISTNSAIHPELLHFLATPKSEYDFDNIIPLSVTRIVPRESKISVEVKHAIPALQGEWFPTTVIIMNKEQAKICNVNMTLTLVTSPENPNPETVTELCLNPASKEQQHPVNILLCDFLPQEEFNQTFYLKSNRVTTVTLLKRFTYNLESQNEASSFQECVREQIIKIPVVKPFEVSAKIVSLNFQSIESCFVDDPIIVMPEIKILSPWKLIIEDTDLELSDNFKYCDDKKNTGCVRNLVVDEGAVTADAACIVAKHSMKERPPRVGIYNIKWKRQCDDRSITIWNSVLSSAPLPALPIKECPIHLNVELPEKGELQTSMSLKCFLSGVSDKPKTITISAEGTDAFMFSGYKKKSLSIRPDGNEVLAYNIHPLVCGNTNPPKFKCYLGKEEVIDDPSSQLVQEMFDKSLPQHAYIMPKEKKKST